MDIEKLSIKVVDRDIVFYHRPDSIGDRGVIQQIFKNYDYRLDKGQGVSHGKRLLDYFNKKTTDRGGPAK